jgi:hypothetical protein
MDRQSEQESGDSFVHWANNPAYTAYWDIGEPRNDRVLDQPHEEWMDLVDWDAGNNDQLDPEEVSPTETDSLRINVDHNEDGDRMEVTSPQQDHHSPSWNSNIAGNLSDASTMNPAPNTPAAQTAPLAAQTATATICFPPVDVAPLRRIQSDAVQRCTHSPRTAQTFQPANTEELTRFVSRLREEWLDTNGDPTQTI